MRWNSPSKSRSARSRAAQQLDLFLERRPRVAKFSPERLYSTSFQPTPTPSRSRPAVEHVDLGRLLGDERRLTLRQDEDRRRADASSGAHAAMNPKRTSGSWITEAAS